MQQYYQLVREYGKYDIQYVVYEARKDRYDNISISPAPFILVGNHPDEIQDTLTAIRKDIKTYPPVDRVDCNVLHERMWHDEDDTFVQYEDVSDEELLKELGVK